MVTIWAKVRAKPEFRQQLLDIVTASALTAEREEPGCVRFDVFQDTADQNVFCLLECYVDQAAFDLHRSKPYYQAWRDAGHMKDGPTEVTRCRPLIPADAAYWAKDRR